MSSRPNPGGPKLRRLNMGQIFIILAVVSGLLTIFIFKSMLSGKSDEKVAEVETRPLVIAAHEILPGEIIGSGSIKVVDWPKEHYPADVDVYEDTGRLIGRAVDTPIYAGEPIFRLNLAGENSKGGLPVVIPPGYRAMTILVNETKGVAGFIKPNDHVDIIGTFELEIPENTKKSLSDRSTLLLEDSIQVTQTVLQNVQVLAIAQEMIQKQNALEKGIKEEPAGKDGKGKEGAKGAPSPEEAVKAKVVSSVTVAVTPEQAEKLAHADSRGQLKLTLRPEREQEQVHLIGAVAEDIIPLGNLLEKAVKITADLAPGFLANTPPMAAGPSGDMPPAMPPMFSSPSAHTVEVIEGASKTTVSF